MARLLTVTLNPALDVVYDVPGFAPGALNRAHGKTVSAGGKGINVARVYRNLGGSVTATGLVGGSAGAEIVDRVRAEGIDVDFVNIAGDSRVNAKVSDAVQGTQTEINDVDPVISAEELRAFYGRLRELLASVDVVVLSGSVPRGVDPGVYADIIRVARDDYSVQAFLDASGEPLRQGILAGPAIVKPNVDEAAAIGIHPVDWRDAAGELRGAYGIETVMVTAGAEGAVVETAEGRWQATPPSIDVKSAVGSGDSLTAAFLSRWLEGPELALRYGVAAGAVNAMSYRSGDVPVELLDRTVKQVTVSRLR